MGKLQEIVLGDGTRIRVVHEDRSVVAIDKPAGWLLAPNTWDRTGRNLQLALESALRARASWAKSRNLKYLRFVHRLDTETSGVLLLAKSPGALRAYGQLFESRRMSKWYLAVVAGVPPSKGWVCRLSVAPDPGVPGKMRAVDPASRAAHKGGERAGGRNAVEPKTAETEFRVLREGESKALVLARPRTGRTHQIRVHLAAGGHPVLGDELYGRRTGEPPLAGMALRAVALAYRDPFTGRTVRIEVPFGEFAGSHGFVLDENEVFMDAERQSR